MKSRTGPLVLTFIIGLVMLGEWFVNTPVMKTWAAELKNWSIIVEAFALGLGAVNLVRMHSENIARKKQGWYGSVFMFIALIVFTAVGLWTDGQGALWQKMYDTVIGPAGTTMFSVLCFCIISAGARCLRLNKITSAVLVASVVIGLITQVPIGEYYFPFLMPVSKWLFNVVNVSGQRGIMIGAALGAFANAVRVLTGIERVSTGSK